MQRILMIFVGALMCVTAGINSEAQTLFEKLVTPGPLVKGHQKYENDCNKCHTPFRRDTQTSLCLDCHDKIASDRKQRVGFHSKNPTAATSECRHCHSDHKGPDADITGLDAGTFDHKQTNFSLEGRHAAVSCDRCHKGGESYRKAPSTCIGCHKADDRHQGRLGENCQSCHDEKAWTKTKTYDHGKTKFPLIDAHQRVACEKCHAGEVYKGVPTNCSGCHNLQDVHKGTYGVKCETCHTPAKWKTIKFNHDRDTKFPLKAAHKAAKCESCHLDNIYEVKISLQCNGCHGRQDPHKGSLGQNCAKCHSESSWNARVAFDHDLSRFPLIGLHAAVGCGACHRTKTYRDAPKACEACHADSHHQGRIGSKCVRCHSPNGWARWTFDHTRDAKFELVGAHRLLTCHGCHKASISGRIPAPKVCIGCHAQDDVHGGSFGTACENCHSAESFRNPRFRR